MPSFCVVSNCEFKYNQSESVSFHKFPQNSDLRKKWIEFTERINWEPSRWSTICSRHFKPIDFKNVNISRKSLKKNALPTVKNISSQEQAKSVNDHNGSNDDAKGVTHLSKISDRTFIRTTESDAKNQENQNIKIESIIPVSSWGNISTLPTNETVRSNSATFTTVHSVQQPDIIDSAPTEILSEITPLTAKVTSSEILPTSANQNYLKSILKNQVSVSLIHENCRLCSNPFTVNDSLESFGSNLEIFRMLQKCFPTLSIQQDDNYPKKICNLCLEKLEDFSEFTDLVASSQRKFVQFEKTPSSRNERIKIKQEPIVRVKQEKAESSTNELAESATSSIQKDNSEKIDIIVQTNQNEDGREMNNKDYSPQQQLCQQQSDSELSCDQKSSQFFDFSILNDDMDIMEIISLDGGFIDIDEMTNDGDNDDNDSILDKKKRIKMNEELLLDSSINANLSQQSLSSCSKELQILKNLNKFETEYKDSFDTKENLYVQNEDTKHFRKDSDHHFLDPLRIANEHNYTKIYEGGSYKIEQPENEDLEYFSQKEIIDLAQDIKPISSNLEFSQLINHDTDQILKSKNLRSDHSDKNEENCDLISTIQNDIASTQISQNEVNNNVSSKSYYSNIHSSEDSNYFTSLIMRDFSTYPPISVSSNLNFPVTSLGQTISQLNFTALENHPIFPEILNSNSKQNSQKSSIVVLNESILKPCNLMHKCFLCNSQFFTKDNLLDHQSNVHKTQPGKNLSIINIVGESENTNSLNTINFNTEIQNEIQENNEIKKKDERKANILQIDRKTFEPNRLLKELEISTTEVETIPLSINHHYQEQQLYGQEQTKNVNVKYDDMDDTLSKSTKEKLDSKPVEILPPSTSSQVFKNPNPNLANGCTLQKQSMSFSCTMCLSSFESKLALNNHRKYLCRFNQSIEFYCKYCNLNLQKWVECRQHEKKCRLLQPPVPRQERKKNRPIKDSKNFKNLISIRNEVETKLAHLVFDSNISSNNENIYSVKNDHLLVQNDNLSQPERKSELFAETSIRSNGSCLRDQHNHHLFDINNFNSKTESNQELNENNFSNNFSEEIDKEKLKYFHDCKKTKTNIKDINELTEESRELIENLQLLKETPINRNYSGVPGYFENLSQKKNLHDTINKPLNYSNISDSGHINANIYLNNQFESNTKIYLKRTVNSNELLPEHENNYTEKAIWEETNTKEIKARKSYKCQICNKDFKALGNLYQHKKTHSNVRKYKCELCGNKDKYFKRLNGLNQHLRGFHQGLRPFACSKCGHCFALKTDAARCRHSKFKKQLNTI